MSEPAKQECRELLSSKFLTEAGSKSLRALVAKAQKYTRDALQNYNPDTENAETEQK